MCEQTTKVLYGKMYKIIGKEETLKVLTLAEAMNVAKHMNEFVTIVSENFEVCGIFGVDSVQNGVCPDGVKYDWDKSARIGRVKKERENVEDKENY
jgi:hypothetical protein